MRARLDMRCGPMASMEAKILNPRRFATDDWRAGRGPWAACALAVAVLVLSLAPGPARAQIANPYEVKGVDVDVTAETASDARAQALREGQQRAMAILLERMTLKSDHARLPGLSPEEITEYIQDFSVAEEKTSAVRYLAKLNYRFRPSEVRELLRAFNIPFAETPSKPVLVLPVLRRAGALLLWDDPNPWRAAWQQRSSQVSLVPTILPLGDLADVAAIGVDQVVAGDRQRLQAMARRYEAGSVVVAFASIRHDPARSLWVLDVTMTRYNVTIDPQTTVVTYVSEFGETADSLLARAAKQVTQLIEDNWKRDNLLQSARQEAIAVRIPIGGLRDWLDMRKRIGSVAVIRETELVQLSRAEAQVILHYIGDVGQLIIALEQADLALRGQGDVWTLEQLRGGKKAG
ncbi:MAG: DUF2066 domain-containing protein [Rhodospirillales bacterium CG15_BIG_FIL_POST_REV_8_21_14_020_66_15]|nr:MAG: DUF2066 domain-containing protein [Rhodospirillales bacterium CG15_BIG_FIL_POST_REV_8_21_14_020_66_15]